jgi:hypothetical protein
MTSTSIAGSFDLDKLAKVCGMLGSTSDNEALVAARAADRMVRDAGLSWQAILVPEIPQPAQRESPLDPIQTRQVANWVRRNFAARLSERERSFIETMSRWQGRPTAKQQKWLRDIASRFEAAA